MKDLLVIVVFAVVCMPLIIFSVLLSRMVEWAMRRYLVRSL